MSKILFRGKTVKTGEWIEGCLSYFIDADFHSFIEDPITMEKMEVIPESVGQYVGLNDVFGRRIFEGDVVEAQDYAIKGTYIVEYSDGEFIGVNKDKTAEHQCVFIKKLWSFKVIGHSYDMPIDTHILKDDTKSSEEDL